MKERFNRLWKSGKATMIGQNDPALERSCAGRIVSTLTFIVVIIFLGLWIAAFLLLKDRLFAKTLSGNVLTNLTCLTFFGGLVIAIFVGALAGNFLRRAFWKMQTGKRK
jgi:hypothetical protein